MTTKRLSKVLAGAGVASRRKCEELIFSGSVTVNDEVVIVPQTQVDIAKDKIRVDGERIHKEEKRVAFIFNKPAGFICSNLESIGRKSVLSFFQDLPYRLFTVGRLDKETEGLMIITNDGILANKIIHPSSNVEKEYIAKTNKEIEPEHLDKIRKGMWVEGTYVKPVKVSKVRKGTIRVVVKEGKKREVRHLVEGADLKVVELKRVRIGNLRLGKLTKGDRRHLTDSDIEAIFA